MRWGSAGTTRAFSSAGSPSEVRVVEPAAAGAARVWMRRHLFGAPPCPTRVQFDATLEAGRRMVAPHRSPLPR